MLFGKVLQLDEIPTFKKPLLLFNCPRTMLKTLGWQRVFSLRKKKKNQHYLSKIVDTIE